MTEAPERMSFIPEGIYDDANPPKMFEYIRADLACPVTVAEAAKVLCGDGYALEYLAHHACCSKSSIVEALRALSQN